MFEQNGVLVQFRTEPKKAQAKSREKGRPVYEDIDVIEIRNPADQFTVIVRAATEQDKRTYRKAWTAYSNENKADKVEGTLLREWRGITRAQAQEAAYFKILTVEQLAEADEETIADLGMEWFDLKKDAELYLLDTQSTAERTAMADENQKLRKQLEEMQKALAEQQQGDDKPKKRGRPAKQETEDSNEE